MTHIEISSGSITLSYAYACEGTTTSTFPAILSDCAEEDQFDGDDESHILHSDGSF